MSVRVFVCLYTGAEENWLVTLTTQAPISQFAGYTHSHTHTHTHTHTRTHTHAHNKVREGAHTHTHTHTHSHTHKVREGVHTHARTHTQSTRRGGVEIRCANYARLRRRKYKLHQKEKKNHAPTTPASRGPVPFSARTRPLTGWRGKRAGVGCA